MDKSEINGGKNSGVQGTKIYETMFQNVKYIIKIVKYCDSNEGNLF